MIDERFKIHRWKSTSLAAVVGGLLLGGRWYWETFVNHVPRHDILAILSAMAAVKIGAMVYYRLTD
jgi:hypothetical protein